MPSQYLSKVAFPDPTRPIATCAEETCDGCPVRGEIRCHFTPRDLLGFLAISLPGLVLGGVGVWLLDPLWIAPWIAWCAAYFGLVEIRVMCSHCPHYAEPGRTLSCWANHGSPRLWRYRPGPIPSTLRACSLSEIPCLNPLRPR